MAYRQATESRQFERLGYTVIEGIIDDQRVSQLVGALPTIETSGSRLLLTIASFRELAERLRSDTRLATFVTGLVAVQCVLFRKSGDHNWAVGLHRDAVLPVMGRGDWPAAGVKEARQSAKPPRSFMDLCVAIRIHLDGAPVEDVSVVPGSHRDSTKYDRGMAKPVAVGAGGALIMRPTLAHASSRLRDHRLRRVLHYVFAPKRIPLDYRWYDAV